MAMVLIPVFGLHGLRTNTKFQKLLANIKSNISFSNIALSLHIRRGDKMSTGDAAFIPDERYTQAVSNIFDQKNIKLHNDINKTKIVHIVCDDQLLKFSKIFSSNCFIKDSSLNFYQKDCNHILLRNSQRLFLNLYS